MPCDSPTEQVLILALRLYSRLSTKQVSVLTLYKILEFQTKLRSIAVVRRALCYIY